MSEKTSSTIAKVFVEAIGVIIAALGIWLSWNWIFIAFGIFLAVVGVVALMPKPED